MHNNAKCVECVNYEHELWNYEWIITFYVSMRRIKLTFITYDLINSCHIIDVEWFVNVVRCNNVSNWGTLNQSNFTFLRIFKCCTIQDVQHNSILIAYYEPYFFSCFKWYIVLTKMVNSVVTSYLGISSIVRYNGCICISLCGVPYHSIFESDSLRYIHLQNLHSYRNHPFERTLTGTRTMVCICTKWVNIIGHYLRCISIWNDSSTCMGCGFFSP